MLDIKLNELKEIDKELLKQIVNQIDDEDIDDVVVEVNDNRYGFSAIEDGSWEDDGRGKYYTKESTYILGLYGENEDKWRFIEKYNVIVSQGVSKTGSYYTDWNYEYEEPTFSYAKEEVIPEQIIPAHTIIALNELKL